MMLLENIAIGTRTSRPVTIDRQYTRSAPLKYRKINNTKGILFEFCLFVDVKCLFFLSSFCRLSIFDVFAVFDILSFLVTLQHLSTITHLRQRYSFFYDLRRAIQE